MTNFTAYRDRTIDETILPTPNVPRAKEYRAKAKRLMMLPIYSKVAGQWQMDTFEQSDNVKELQNITGMQTRGQSGEQLQKLSGIVKDRYPPYFLILINVNTRKAYAYPMKNKGEAEVRAALEKFLIDAWSRNGEPITEIFSDDDAAYKGGACQRWYNANDITHVHTTSDNKHTLGILNRFIKTIRDNIQSRNVTAEQMANFVDKYNDRKHAVTGVKPNYMTADEEKKYVMDQYQKEQAIKAAMMLDTSMKARRYIDRKIFEKRRGDFDVYQYPIVGVKGKIYQIKQGKNIVNVPRWKLKTTEGIKPIDGNPVRIIHYSKKWNMYNMEFDNGKDGWVSFEQLRGDNLYQLHPLENKYWSTRPLNDVPLSVRPLLQANRIRLVTSTPRRLTLLHA